MRRILLSVALAATVVTPAFAGRNKRTAGEAARTGGVAVKNGARTFGRSTRAFFKGGGGAARDTWKANAHQTKEETRAHGRRTRHAARR